LPDIKLHILAAVVTAAMLFGWAPAEAVAPVHQPDTISTIIISGNRVTKNQTVLYIAELATGMRYDSLKIATARANLKKTNLFYKVDILTLRGGDGYRIYIIVLEKFYLLPSDLGGELYSYRYGKQKTWWRLRVGMEYDNFRGNAEILRASFSIWDWHSMGFGWYKPFLPSPYFFSFGVSADQFPDEIFRIDHSILRGTFTAGRKLPLNSRVDLSIMPMYRRRIMLNDNLTVSDTVKVYETFSLLRWRTDYRDQVFDPASGWLVALDLRTNALYNGIAPRFFQFNEDIRWYTRGLVESHRLACRLTSTLRSSDAGVTHRIQLGGEGSVRGFPRSMFGLSFIANNSLTMSMEYRFPIYTFPDMDLFMLNRFSSVFSAIEYRIDGALIIDHGRVADIPENLFVLAPTHRESGSGIGAGLRVVTPTFERSVCFDLVWGTDPRAPTGHMRFLSSPMWHFYLDMYF
jgi:outer membrane protein assembly factor BamA